MRCRRSGAWPRARRAQAGPRACAPALTRPPRAQASIVHYARRITEAASDGAAVLDCVVAVPAFFGPAQRQALVDAAQLAGALAGGRRRPTHFPAAACSSQP